MPVAAVDRRWIREMAGGLCAYCRMAEAWEPFFAYHIEHIIAKQHGGPDHRENLALACYHCNFQKGPNLSSIDPDTGKVTVLFHPRRQVGTIILFRNADTSLVAPILAVPQSSFFR